MTVLLSLGIMVTLVALGAMRDQRWFKKILFYYFPHYLRPISSKHKFVNVYFKHLTPEERKRFEWRAYYFLSTTDIQFKNFASTGLVNYNSVRYLIASVATQMSLFLTEDCFDAFHTIIIYPDQYYSRVTGQYHKGETNPAAGVIVLSYSNLTSGFERRDGINLLMHELAHALWLENKLFDYEIFDPGALSTYQQVAGEEFKRMQISEDHFLRKYASTNEEEFFAVAVENFFERPQQFNEALPDLYRAMVALLKQDTFKLQL